MIFYLRLPWIHFQSFIPSQGAFFPHSEFSRTNQPDWNSSRAHYSPNFQTCHVFKFSTKDLRSSKKRIIFCCKAPNRWKPATLTNTEIVFKEIDQELKTAAIRFKAIICYGTIGWEESKDVELKYFICQTVIDANGDTACTCDKIHLCDHGDCAETRFFTPGQKAVSFSLKGWKFEVIVCADIRYPMLARKLARDHTVDVILQPARLIRDVSSNGVYFCALNYTGEDFGEASLVPPWVDEDHEPTVLGIEEGYLVAQLDKNVLNQARKDLPFSRNVRDKPHDYFS